MGMIAVVLASLKLEHRCWVADKEMSWPSPADRDPTPTQRRL
jgi:hypothetical protein